MLLPPVHTVVQHDFGLLGADTQLHAHLCGGDFFGGSNAAKDALGPDGSAPGGAATDVVGKNPGAADAPFCHFVGRPEFKHRLAKAFGQQVPARAGEAKHLASRWARHGVYPHSRGGTLLKRLSSGEVQDLSKVYFPASRDCFTARALTATILLLTTGDR